MFISLIIGVFIGAAVGVVAMHFYNQHQTKTTNKKGVKKNGDVIRVSRSRKTIN